jgi:hypothetical protein
MVCELCHTPSVALLAHLHKGVIAPLPTRREGYRLG